MTSRTGGRRVEDDPAVVGWLAKVARWRGAATAIWMLLAAAATMMGLVWKFSPRLDHLSNHQAIIELHLQITDAKIDSLYRFRHIVEKAVCLDHSKVQQQMLDMYCPDNLYKGATP